LRSVLVVEETGGPGENHTCRKSLTNFDRNHHFDTD
jgi:hypothetical protein